MAASKWRPPNGGVVEKLDRPEVAGNPLPNTPDDIPELAALLPQRSRWPFVTASVAIGVAATMLAQFLIAADTDEQSAEATTGGEFTTVAVETRDLIEEVTWEGDLAYSESGRVLAGRSGTVTEAVEAGELLERGDLVASIDNVPTTVMYGSVPFYRTLRSGLSGPDVTQLEMNLVLLGFDLDGTLSVDELFSANTAAAVERWQEATGASETGRVSPQSVVLLPGPSLVSTVVEPGDLTQPTTPLLTYEVTQIINDVLRDEVGVVSDVLEVASPVVEGTTLFNSDELSVVAFTEAERFDEALVAYEEWAESDQQDEADEPPPFPVLVAANSQVTAITHDDDDDDLVGRPILSLGTSTLAITVPVLISDADGFVVGTDVSIVLPDQSTTTGTITDIGRAVTPASEQNNSPTIDVTVLLHDVPGDPLAVNTGVVEVETIAERIEDAMVVPTRALVALRDGGYAVERIDEADKRELLAVTIGAIDDGFVEITESPLSPGDLVAVPS